MGNLSGRSIMDLPYSTYLGYVLRMVAEMRADLRLAFFTRDETLTLLFVSQVQWHFVPPYAPQNGQAC